MAAAAAVEVRYHDDDPYRVRIDDGEDGGDAAEKSSSSHSDLPSVAAACLSGHGAGPIHMVRFTADGKYCLTAGNDRTVRLWNPTRIDPAYQPRPDSPASPPSPSGSPSLPPPALPIQTYAGGHFHPVYAIAVDSESSTLLSSSDKTLVVADLVTTSLKRRLRGHAGRINSLCVLGGGGVYASGSYDGTVRLWDGRSRSHEPMQILTDANDSVSSVAGVSDAEIVTASIDGKVRTYDLRMGRAIAEDITHPITSIGLTSDGTCVASSCLDGSIRFWERASARARAATAGTTLGVLRTFRSAHTAGNYGLECSFSADNRYVASGSEDGALVLYDTESEPIGGSEGGSRTVLRAARRLVRHAGPVCSVACCPDASAGRSVVVSAGYDGNAYVWANEEVAQRVQEER